MFSSVIQVEYWESAAVN